jgi:hypothetical protein
MPGSAILVDFRTTCTLLQGLEGLEGERTKGDASPALEYPGYGCLEIKILSGPGPGGSEQDPDRVAAPEPLRRFVLPGEVHPPSAEVPDLDRP